MLGKLFKHELWAMSRIMLPVTAVLLVLAGLSNVSVRYIDLVQSDFLTFVLALFLVLFFIGMVAAGVVLIVVIVSRFYNNLLKDEGYLMFTLPVSTHELVWSKLLASLVWTIVSALIMAGLIWVTAMHAISVASDTIHISFDLDLSGMLRYLSENFDITGGYLPLLIVEGVFGIIIASFSSCLLFYAAMSIGQSFANHKVLMSVVFFLLISFAAQIVTPYIYMGIGELYSNVSFDINNFKAIFQQIILVSLAVELAYSAILYVITNIFLKKRLNLG